MNRQKSSILVVDDDPTILRLLVLTLREAGFEVIAAHDGAEALEQAARHPIEMVLLDLEMPVMDGASFYRALRRSGSRVPVMVLSAHGAARAARQLGADGWMEKPYDEVQLLGQVRDLAYAGRRQIEGRHTPSLLEAPVTLGLDEILRGAGRGASQHRRRKVGTSVGPASDARESRGRADVA